jgi:xanthine dehydrogenase accessory factor
MIDWLATLVHRLETEPALVRVEVAAVRGSAPREPGACMLVGASRVDGSIGGGHLEWKAIEIARGMLAGSDAVRSEKFSLGATLGQCCGGAVELRFERCAQADRDALVREIASQPRPAATPLWLFGAGHVGRALVQMLGELAFAVTWIDRREGIFPARLPANVIALDAEVVQAPAGAFFLVMTHSHDLDYEIVRAVLRRGDFAWAGMIGSETKALRFRQRLARQGLPPERIARLVSPIGVAGIESKLPGAIALAAAAQLQQVFESRAALAGAGAQARAGG